MSNAEIIGYAVAGVFVLIALAVGRRTMRKLGKSLSEAGRQHGGVATRAGDSNNLPVIEVSYGPSTTRVTGHTGRSPLAIYTSARTTLNQGSLPPFELKARGTFSRAPKLGLGADFDRQYAVKCADPDAVRAIWSARAVELAVALGNPVLTGEGKLAAIDLTIRTQPNGFEIRFRRLLRHQATHDMLLQLVEELVNAATWAERSRPSPVA